MSRSISHIKTPRLSSGNRVKTRNAGRAEGTTNLRELGLMVFGVVLLVISAVTGYQIQEVSREIAAYREGLKAFGREEERLMREIDGMKSRQNLERLGASLGLHPPEKTQVVHLK